MKDIDMVRFCAISDEKQHCEALTTYSHADPTLSNQSLIRYTVPACPVPN